ncbi:MAG TPA: hypothetical protein VNZ05_06995 [Solirubrobacteraceae bacterium]|jgi:hypothetical protein|nr:hypothetical protein [Solirubrobacteraceae bacterium]
MRRFSGTCAAVAVLVLLPSGAAAAHPNHHQRCHHTKRHRCPRSSHRHAAVRSASQPAPALVAATPLAATAAPEAGTVRVTLGPSRLETPSEVEAEAREARECAEYLGPGADCTLAAGEGAGAESSPTEWERECRELMPGNPACVLAPDER